MTSYSLATAELFGKLMTGEASLSHVPGPLTITDATGWSAVSGIQNYLEFLALADVSLGVMNLLPAPVLGGGHLIYYTAEQIREKLLSEYIQAIGLRFGLVVMLMLILMAFFSDTSRLFR